MTLTASVSFLRVLNIVDGVTSFEPTATGVRKFDIEVSAQEFESQNSGTTNLLELVKRALDRFRAEQYPEDKDEIYRLGVEFCGLKWETERSQQQILREENLSKFDATHNTEYFLYYRETRTKRKKRKSLPGKSGSGSSITRQKRIISVKNQNFARLFVANLLTKLREQLILPNDPSEEREDHFHLYTKMCRKFLRYIDVADVSFPRLSAVETELCGFLQTNQSKNAEHSREIDALKDWIHRNFENLCTISTTGKWIDLQSKDPQTHKRTHDVYYFDDAVEFDAFIRGKFHALSVDDGIRNIAMDLIVESNLIVIAESVYRSCIIEDRERKLAKQRLRRRLKDRNATTEEEKKSDEEKEQEETVLECRPKFCTDEFHVNHPIGVGDYACIVSGEIYSYMSLQKCQIEFESHRKASAKRRSHFGVTTIPRLIHESSNKRPKKPRPHPPHRAVSSTILDHHHRERSQRSKKTKRKREAVTAKRMHSSPVSRYDDMPTRGRSHSARQPRSNSFDEDGHVSDGGRKRQRRRLKRSKTHGHGREYISDVVPACLPNPFETMPDFSQPEFYPHPELGRTHSLPVGSQPYLDGGPSLKPRRLAPHLVNSLPAMYFPPSPDIADKTEVKELPRMASDSPSSPSLSSNASTEHVPLSSPRVPGNDEDCVSSTSPHEEKTPSVHLHSRPSIKNQDQNDRGTRRGGKLMRLVKNIGLKFQRNAKPPEQ